uniref:Uncharacterized protein n=1 Tax=Anguilla anguilla TaxID=7936 RepID=A0A0E9QZW2_ANGAN
MQLEVGLCFCGCRVEKSGLLA